MLKNLLRSTASTVSKAYAFNTVAATRAIAARSMSMRVACDGNEATAASAYNVSETAIIFPITPSSPMGEHCDAWAVQGRKNIFGQRVQVIEMQSEAGAMGALHGALVGGVLGTTFSSSQGLMLMIPDMCKVSGELLPGVLHVASRSVSKNTGCLYCDYSDVYTTRGTGFCYLNSHSVQEAHDLALVAHIAALESSYPILPLLRRFPYLSRNIRKLVPWDKVEEFRANAMNPEHPHIRGTAQNPDIFFQNREASNLYYDAVPGIVLENMKKVAAITGRKHRLFDYVGHPEADRVIISMGSSCEVIQETVNYLNERGQRVGLVKVHLFRPFSAEHLLQAIPATATTITVLDRTKEPGSLGEPLYQDVCTAFMEKGEAPTIVGGRYGLGSKDFTPGMAKAVFDNMLGLAPKNHFTVGIHDDVTNLSLDVEEEIDTVPAGTVQCKFFGLGADGTVGANKQAVKIIGDNTDMYAQAYFAYDSKKSGGFTVSHLRFGKSPIQSSYLITQADYIACHKAAYVTQYDILDGIKDGGTFVLNSNWSLEDMEKHLPASMKRTIARKHLKFFNVDAVAVAQEVGLGGRINMIMQTAFFKLAKVLPESQSTELIANNIRKRYAKKGQEVVDMNITAMEQAGKELVKIEVPASWKQCEMLPLHTFPAGATDAYKNLQFHVAMTSGDDLPVSRFIPGGRQENDTARFEKRGFAAAVPMWDSEKCTQCNQCATICPHSVIRPFLLDANEVKKAPAAFKSIPAVGDELKGLNFRIQMSPLDCTGCEVCVNVCPTQALTMTPMSKVRDEQSKNWEYAMSLTNKGNLVDKTTVKGCAFQTPMLEFNGACAGCGEMTILKMLTQLYGERIMFADAMGCTMVSLGGTGVSPFTRNHRGHGPTWGCSLFEDNAQYGYGLFKSIQVRRAKLESSIQDALKSNAPMSAELKSGLQKWLDNKHDADVCISVYDQVVPLLEKEKSKSPAIKAVADYQDMIPDLTTWIIGGDGWSYDIGFGGLDHVMAQGENVKVLIFDTEMYANTGGQQSKATQMSAVAKFAAGGKRQMKKDMGKHMMGYKNIYVASVAVGADPKQALKALVEAQTYDGPAIIISYSPCQQHGMPSKLGMSHLAEEERRAVDCGYWPLYRYDPRRAEKGENPFQLDFKKLKSKVADYLEGENRYTSLERSQPEVAKKLHEELQKQIDIRHAERVRMAMSDKQLYKELNKTFGK
ncbi:hypothetical protein WA538_005783 [Blastocystis sp. DL]